jgi:hypothetical protein
VVHPLVQHCAAHGLPVFYSFEAAVRAISLVVKYYRNRENSS